MASAARAAAARIAQRTGAVGTKILGVVAQPHHQAWHASGSASSSSKTAIAVAIAGVAGVVGAGASLVVAEGGESGGGAWGRRGMSQGKYYGLKKEEGDGMAVQGEDDKFFDADYAYLMVSGIGSLVHLCCCSYIHQVHPDAITNSSSNSTTGLPVTQLTRTCRVTLTCRMCVSLNTPQGER